MPQATMAADIRPELGAMLVFGDVGGGGRLALAIEDQLVAARQRRFLVVLGVPAVLPIKSSRTRPEIRNPCHRPKRGTDR